MNRWMIGLALMLGLCLAAPVWAQQGGILPPSFDPDKPIHIAADRLEADQNEELVRFVDNVVVVQNDAVLNCDLLIIHYQSQQKRTPESGGELAGLAQTGGQIKRLLAIGRVQMVQGERRATCDRAEYDHQTETITLTGNPEVGQGRDVLRGAKIVIQVKGQRVHIVGQGSRRVTATIDPRSARDAAQQASGGQKEQED